MNTIKILLISVIMSISSSVISQYNFDFGVKLGMANYLGEIGGKEQTARRFVWDMKLNETNFAAGAYARYKFNGYYGLNVSLNYGKISGDDVNSENRARNTRNLRFKNNIFNLSIENELYLFELNDVGGTGRYWVDMKAYVFGGVSAFIHNPKGQLSGDSEWYDLRPLQTEGVAYKKVGFGIPAGIGLYFTYKRQHRFGWNISWTTTFTDYLDDISSTFVDPTTLGSDLSRQLANQSATSSEAGNEAFLNNFAPGQKRGDIEYNDSYMFTTFTYGYLIRGQPSFYKQNYGFLGGKKKKSRKVRAKF